MLFLCWTKIALLYSQMEGMGGQPNTFFKKIDFLNIFPCLFSTWEEFLQKKILNFETVLWEIENQPFIQPNGGQGWAAQHFFQKFRFFKYFSMPIQHMGRIFAKKILKFETVLWEIENQPFLVLKNVTIGRSDSKISKWIF